MRCPKVMRARTRTKLFFLPRLRDHLQNTAIPLAVNCVISFLIVPSKYAPHVSTCGRGNPANGGTVNGHGRFTDRDEWTRTCYRAKRTDTDGLPIDIEVCLRD